MVMEIIREGLIITPTGSLEPSQGSYNVPVKLINDETYPNYTINMYIGYYINGAMKKIKCETDSEGHYLIPGIAFLRSGIISISFLLESTDKSQGLMTNALSYEIKHAPNVVVEVPADPTWQELVKEWIQELAGAVNVDNTLTKSGMAADAKATGDAISKLSDSKTNLSLFEKLIETLGYTLADLVEKLPQVRIVGSTTGISADDYVTGTLNYVDELNNVSFTDYVEFAYQGSSSLNFTNVENGVDKAKNYKIKLYSDEECTVKNKRVFKDWFGTNNFHLKCNYGDCTNFMNNMMMNFLTKSYQFLTPLPREGARYTVDGFPILLYINDVFCGIRFWNLKQDDKVYNLTKDTDLCYQIGLNNGSSKGDNSGAFIYGNLNSGSNASLNFADAHAEIDYYWEDRVWDKTSNHPSVLYDTIQWVSEASDEEFKANLEQYFDKEYLIHYFVIMYSLGMGDSICKNFNMLYFPDMGKWYATWWDMDFACGTSWSLETVPYNIDVLSSTYGASRLFTKLWANFTDECKQWYWELRKSFLTVDNILDSINNVWGNVSSDWIEQNKIAKYGASNTTFKTDGESYVKTWVTNRLNYMDTLMYVENAVHTTSITLDKETLSFDDFNVTQTLVATVLPSDTEDITIWESSDNSIATVSNGVVTSIGNGSCTITATSGSCSATCNVKVSKVKELELEAIQGNASDSSTDTNRVTVFLKDVRIPSQGTLSISCGDGYSFGVYRFIVTNDETASGTYPKANHISTRITADNGVSVNTSTLTDAVDTTYSGEGSFAWSQSNITFATNKYSANGLTFDVIGILIKKTDDSTITTDEALSNITISGYEQLS